MRGILALGALVLAGASFVVQADVYRWIDSAGEVHYSDRWVPGSTLVKVDRSKVRADDASAPNSGQNRLAVTTDRVDSQLAQNAETRAVKNDVATARTEQCKSAKERYEKAIQARRIFRTGKEGEREYLSDIEADEWRLQARTEMQQACGASG
jgi:hypothetical protein